MIPAYRQGARHTPYQVSTATALVEGIYQGAVRVGTLREHGDLGLGTFENLDGEMVIVDGQFFQLCPHGILTLRDAALRLGFVTAEQFDAWVRPEDMHSLAPVTEPVPRAS
jgi:acetolactate decarboxylase